MTDQPHAVNSDANELPAEVAELISAIQQLPNDTRTAIEPALTRVVESTRRRRRILTTASGAPWRRGGT